MKNVKIFGAGSIGNHMANAARALGASVDVVDKDPEALDRMKSEIYPQRYGQWDDNIKLHVSGSEPIGNHDFIVIGTPPDSHIELARSAVNSKPLGVLIEKPLCSLGLEGLDHLKVEAKENQVQLFVGYDHVVGKAAKILEEHINASAIGNPITIDVEWREHWSGIFAAHPWLNGPTDSYLGFSELGGGASGEHSHALNFWQHICQLAGGGRISEVDARLDYGKNYENSYDSICLMNFCTETGLLGRCVQDVITRPHKKWASIQGDSGRIEWHCSFQPGADKVLLFKSDGKIQETIVTKTRPDDFIMELEHIRTALQDNSVCSPIDIERGIDTMSVLIAAQKSNSLGKRVRVEYLN